MEEHTNAFRREAKMKKIFAVLLCVILCLSAGRHEVKADTDEKLYIEGLIEEGLNEEEARQLYHVDLIINQLEEDHLTVELQNGIYAIFDSEGKDVTEECVIGKRDREFLFEVLERSSKVTHEMMMEDLERQMAEYSDRSVFRIEYENGSWVQVTRHIKRNDEILTDELIPCFSNMTYPNEKEIKHENCFGDGIYSYDYEMAEWYGIAYAKNLVAMQTQISNSNHHVRVIGYYGGQSSSGASITISNAYAACTTSDVDYYAVPTMWCEVYNQVVYSASSSLGFNVGPFSFSVPNGNCWTQYAILRSSLNIFHAYAAYYV